MEGCSTEGEVEYFKEFVGRQHAHKEYIEDDDDDFEDEEEVCVE